MAEERAEENINIEHVENLYIGDIHIQQAITDTPSVPTTSQGGSDQESDVEQQAIDEIRKEAEIDARDDKLSSAQCPDVNPTMLETDFYRGVDQKNMKQLQPSSQPRYASQLNGKQISCNDLTSMISDGRGKFIILYGNPGSGKTTLSKKIVRQLQKNKKNLVLHLSFMYLNCGNDKLTLQELLIDNQFPDASQSTCNVAFQWIVKNQVLCYFVFDGLDQATWSLENVQPVKRKYDTPMLVQQLVANLCSKMFLGKSSLIFTSRPHSLLSLLPELRPKTTISVQDFSTEDMKTLFYFYAGEKASELWEKLETKSPQILDFCHNPMLLQFVVYAGLHDNAEDLNTITNIFDVVLKQLGNSKHTHGYDIDHLKRPLGKMAYKGMLNKTVVFHSKDLEEVGLQEVDVQDVVIKVACYDRLTERKVFKGNEVLFYCSHQMLQEVFAAYYMCLFMPLEEFKQVVKEVVKGEHWSMVRRFMCGILLGNANDSSSNEATTSQHGMEGDVKRKEKRKAFLRNLNLFLLFERHYMHELIVDFQECCEEVKNQLASCYHQVLRFSSIFPMAQCHALCDFLPRITRNDVGLQLANCNLDHVKLQQLYNGMKNLKVKLQFLDLTGNEKIGKNEVEIISGIFTKVQALGLDGCGFDSESIRILKEVLDKLEDKPLEVYGLSLSLSE